MDDDLKQYLDGKFESAARLGTEVKESFEREIHTGFETLQTRFDAQALRMDRQAALIQTSSRWTARMNDWAERVDVALDKKSQEIAELRTRLEKLEGRDPAA